MKSEIDKFLYQLGIRRSGKFLNEIENRKNLFMKFEVGKYDNWRLKFSG